MKWLISSWNRVSTDLSKVARSPAWTWRDRLWQILLGCSATVPLSILASLLGVFTYQSFLFFRHVSPWHFFTATQWTPLFASRQFGVLPLVCATFLVTAIALTLAIPIGLFAAIYLSEYAPRGVRRLLKPTFESLAGIPTVVYGYFALFFLTPTLKTWIPQLSGFNTLSAGIVTGILVVPTIASIGEDAFRNIPEVLREGGYALGLNKREAIVQVLLPVAFPGLVAAVTLAAARAFSETTIAAIAGGQLPQLTLNPLEPAATMTAFILQVSLGDIPTQSLLFEAIFTIGFLLFLVTLASHTFGHRLVRRHSRAMAGWEIPMAESSQRPLTADVPTSLSETAPVRELGDSFAITLKWRTYLDILFATIGGLASALGIGVFALLAWQLRPGLGHLNWGFLTQFPSRNPSASGIYPALMGTVLLLVLTAILAFPVGIAAAVFLEEYLPRNRFSRGLDIVLANLAAVPSILYGLLGLAVFARIGSRWTGGRSLLSAALVMAAIVLPILAIATRTALRRVPQSQRQAAYAVGMSRAQTVIQVVLPAAFPGIVTGMLLSLSRALGETVPLIAIGAMAFVSFAPDLSLSGLQGSFTTLSTQIFYWVSRPQAEFQEIAATAILVLGGLLLLMNGLAALVRERRS